LQALILGRLTTLAPAATPRRRRARQRRESAGANAETEILKVIVISGGIGLFVLLLCVVYGLDIDPALSSL
jgi:hypothetical protein